MYLLYIRGLHGGADTTIRKTEAFGTDGAILASDKEKPLYRGPRNAAQCGVPRRKNFRWGHNEHALRGKGAIARKQTESRFFKRLSCSLARIATRERTRTYVSIHDGGFDAVSRKIARDGVPHVLSRNGTLNRLIRMRCAKAPLCRTRGVLVVHKRSARRG